MKTIGLIIDGVSTPYFQEIWTGIRRRCRERGINLMTLVSGKVGTKSLRPGRLDQLINRVADPSFDGFIVLTAPLAGRLDADWLARFVSSLEPRPVISIGAPLGNFPWLHIDQKPGCLALLEHLTQVHGYRRFAYAGGPSDNLDAHIRRESFQNHLHEHGLECPPENEVAVDFSAQGGRLAVEELLTPWKGTIDALVCGNDEIALGAMEALARRGIRVPEDIAVVGFDDVPEAGLAMLTTVSQSLVGIGLRSADLVCDQAEGLSVPEVEELQTSLVQRHSCGCAVHDSPLSPESRLRLSQAGVRHRLARDQLTDFTELLVNSRNAEEQNELLNTYLPALGVQRFILSLEGKAMSSAKDIPEPWSFVEEALYDRNTPLGTVRLDVGEDPEALSLIDEIGDRVARGVETIQRIRNLEDLVARRTAELHELALHDELTGLYNRRGFLTLAEHMLKAQKRTHQPLTLFFGDLDGLKRVNDTEGHDAGDEAIRTAARLMTETFRAEDLLARIGGDEFVVLVPGCMLINAQKLADRLSSGLANAAQGRFGLSLGWVVIEHEQKKSLEGWLKDADDALYREKEKKRRRERPGEFNI